MGSGRCIPGAREKDKKGAGEPGDATVAGGPGIPGVALVAHDADRKNLLLRRHDIPQLLLGRTNARSQKDHR
jgi:hypothetical protein